MSYWQIRHVYLYSSDVLRRPSQSFCADKHRSFFTSVHLPFKTIILRNSRIHFSHYAGQCIQPVTRCVFPLTRSCAIKCNSRTQHVPIPAFTAQHGRRRKGKCRGSRISLFMHGETYLFTNKTGSLMSLRCPEENRTSPSTYLVSVM